MKSVSRVGSAKQAERALQPRMMFGGSFDLESDSKMNILQNEARKQAEDVGAIPRISFQLDRRSKKGSISK